MTTATKQDPMRVSRFAVDKKHAARIAGLFTWLEMRRVRIVGRGETLRVMAMATLIQLAEFAALEAKRESRTYRTSKFNVR